jgi:hypothetical protein
MLTFVVLSASLVQSNNGLVIDRLGNSVAMNKPQQQRAENQ